MKRRIKKAITHDSMPWATSSFESKHCRHSMRHHRIILDANDESWFAKRKAEVVQKFKELKSSLEKAKESPKVKKAIKAAAIILAMVSGSTLGYFVTKAVKGKLGSDANAPVNEIVNGITQNVQPIVEVANSGEVSPQTANLCKSSASNLSDLRKGVKAILTKYGKQQNGTVTNSDFFTEPVMNKVPPKQETVSTSSSRNTLKKDLKDVKGIVETSKKMIQSIRPGLFKNNEDIRASFRMALNKLTMADRNIPMNVTQDDFTQKHKAVAMKALQDALSSVNSAIDSFNGTESSSDESAVNLIAKRIQEAISKLSSTRVLDSKRIRIDGDSVRRYIEAAIKREIKRYTSYFRDASVKGIKKSQHV